MYHIAGYFHEELIFTFFMRYDIHAQAYFTPTYQIISMHRHLSIRYHQGRDAETIIRCWLSGTVSQIMHQGNNQLIVH